MLRIENACTAVHTFHTEITQPKWKTWEYLMSQSARLHAINGKWHEHSVNKNYGNYDDFENEKKKMHLQMTQKNKCFIAITNIGFICGHCWASHDIVHLTAHFRKIAWKWSVKVCRLVHILFSLFITMHQHRLRLCIGNASKMFAILLILSQNHSKNYPFIGTFLEKINTYSRQSERSRIAIDFEVWQPTNQT